MTTEREYLTMNEAAQLAEVTPRTIYRWIDEGRLTGYTPARGRGRRVRRVDVERIMEEMIPLESAR